MCPWVMIKQRRRKKRDRPVAVRVPVKEGKKRKRKIGVPIGEIIYKADKGSATEIIVIRPRAKERRDSGAESMSAIEIRRREDSYRDWRR